MQKGDLILSLNRCFAYSARFLTILFALVFTSVVTVCIRECVALEVTTHSRLTASEQESVLSELSRSLIPGDSWKTRALTPLERFDSLDTMNEIVLRHLLSTKTWNSDADKRSKVRSELCRVLLQSMTSWHNVRALNPSATLFSRSDRDRLIALFDPLNFSMNYFENTMSKDLHKWLVSKAPKVVHSLPDAGTLELLYGQSFTFSSEEPRGLHSLKVFLPGGVAGRNPYQLSAKNNVAFVHIENLPQSTLELLDVGKFSRAVALYLKGSKYLVVLCQFDDRTSTSPKSYSRQYPKHCSLADVVYTPVRQNSYIDAASAINGFHLIVDIDLSNLDSDAQHPRRIYALVELIRYRDDASHLRFRELNAGVKRTQCDFRTADSSAVPSFLELIR